MRWILLLLVVALGACKKPGQVTVHQYDTVPAPVVGRGVTLYLGDVENGKHAEVRVTAPNGDVLAVGDLEVHDELSFEYAGEAYVVIAVRYEDHTIDDIAELRVEHRARKPRADQVEIEEGAAGSVPQRPDDRLEVGAIEVDRQVDITHTSAGGPPGLDSYAIGESKQVQHGGADYSLTLMAVTFVPGGVDRAVLRFRPGRQ